MTFYIDVDGTMTLVDKPGAGLASYVVTVVKRLIEEDHEVYVWSARGRRYAEQFCKKHQIAPTGIMSKPDVIVDDKAPDIRPPGAVTVFAPAKFVMEYHR